MPRTRGTLEHAQNALVRGRHHRKAIAPASVIRHFDGVFVFGKWNLPGLEGNFTKAGLQPFRHPRLHRKRAAPRLQLRQFLAESRDSGQLPPLAPVPAHGAFHLLPVFAADEGGNRFDLQPKGLLQIPVVHDGGEPLRKAGIVLTEDLKRSSRIFHFPQHGLHEFAGGAVVLDDDDPAVCQ